MSASGIIKGKFHRVFFNDELKPLAQLINRECYSSIIILTDSNTERLCLKKFVELTRLKKYFILTIQAGEENKLLSSAEKLWEQLMPVADRKSLLINLGGGMVTDLGGFVASVFKRGIDFIHVPTTLLAMTDAAIGGKTAVNFANHKNQLGTFAFPKAVFISVNWLNTLPKEQLLSGKAELAKQAILGGKNEWKKFILNCEYEKSITTLIQQAVKFKIKITDNDIFEKGERKQLNFGHTIGHAVESFCLLNKKPVTHGAAVACGMICELIIAEKIFGLKANPFGEQLEFLIEKFPKIKFTEKETEEIISFVAGDKKNNRGKIKPVLLKKIGNPIWNKEVTLDVINESLKYYIGL